MSKYKKNTKVFQEREKVSVSVAGAMQHQRV